MIVNNLDLDSAIAEGVVSRDQALRLRDLAARAQAAGDAPIDFSQGTRDEPFRLLRGFRDVFIAIGVLIFSVGVSALSSQLIGWRSIEQLRQGDLSGASLWAVAVAGVLCLVGLAQAEIVTRRQRLPLASLAVAVVFAFWSASLSGTLTLSLTQALLPPEQIHRYLAHFVFWSLPGGAILGTAFFYWRFRLPFALLLLAASLFGLSFAIVNSLAGDGWFAAYGRLLIGAWGLVIFAAAMRFDIKDRLRVTRLSECAFWLHIFAAPLLIHALLYGGPLGATQASPLTVLGTVVALALIALLIDRRALLVSGLSYLAVAIWSIVSSSPMLETQRFAVTAFILGAFVLALGLGWTPVRRAVLAVLPLEALKSRLPPAAA